jgi:hypothetical protein
MHEGETQQDLPEDRTRTWDGEACVTPKCLVEGAVRGDLGNEVEIEHVSIRAMEMDDVGAACKSNKRVALSHDLAQLGLASGALYLRARDRLAREMFCRGALDYFLDNPV